MADPEQRGEGGRAYPVQSTVVASLVQSDGKQTLLVQCLVQDPETELAVGSAQHLVEVTNDGTITPRWPLLGVQDCCGRTWWTRPTLSSSTLVPGAVQVSGAFEDSGDAFGLEASKAMLYLLPTAGPASTSLEPCETQGLVPLAGPDHLLVIEEGVVANPLQWLLRTRTRIEGGRITLTERWTPVNQPGLTGVYYETLPSGPRGKKVSTRRTIRWDTTQKRLVEPCPSTPRPDASEE